MIANAPEHTRWWVDEAYLGYVGMAESLASLAAVNPRVVVCTSLSKMYALSGMRVAYLVTAPSVTAVLRRWTPPWPVSLPAQLAAVAALRDPAYYQQCWQRTHSLRRQLATDLTSLDQGMVVQESVANFLNITLPRGGPSAAHLVHQCRRLDVYLRDLSPMSSEYRGRTVRIAVKEHPGQHTNRRRVCSRLRHVAQRLGPSGTSSGITNLHDAARRA